MPVIFTKPERKKKKRMNLDKTRAVSFSGHRTIPWEDLPELKKSVRSNIINLIKERYTIFICGMAIGFDALCAEEVINLKREYPEIKLIAAVPYLQQADNWNERDKNRYLELLKHADDVYCLNNEYTPYCFKKRNYFMVDNSNVLITYMIKDKTGTAQTVNYADKKGVKVINVIT